MNDELEYRSDRCCESCGEIPAAFVPNVDEVIFLCETCMKVKMNKKLSEEDIIKFLEKRWKTKVDAKMDTCPDCGRNRIFAISIDKKRVFRSCACGSQEGFQDTRFFGLRW